MRAVACRGRLAHLVVVMVLLSRLKHDVAQMTVNFVDLMVSTATPGVCSRSSPSAAGSVHRTAGMIVPLCMRVVDQTRPHPSPAAWPQLSCLAALAEILGPIPRRAGADY